MLLGYVRMRLLIPLYNTVFRMLIICCGGDLRNDDNDFLVQLCKLSGKLLKVLMLTLMLNGDVTTPISSNACNILQFILVL